MKYLAKIHIYEHVLPIFLSYFNQYIGKHNKVQKNLSKAISQKQYVQFGLKN